MVKKDKDKLPKQTNEKTGNHVKRNYKDGIFRELFNNEEALRELYSALSDSEIDENETLEILTLVDTIFSTLKNDLAFRLGMKVIILIEHQSTDSPNIPVRMFCYLAEIFEELMGDDVYGTAKISLPKPELYVFYNGKEDREQEWTQRLSDLFADQSGDLTAEVVVKVININYEKGAEILKKCKTLQGYSLLIHKVKTYMDECKNLDRAMETAIKECIDEGFLEDFLRKNGGKVMSVLRKVWTEEDIKELSKRIGYKEGHEKGMVDGLTEGLAKGHAEGLAKGHAEGLAKGHAEGHAEACAEMNYEHAAKMKKDGMPTEQIMRYVDMTRAAIEAIPV